MIILVLATLIAVGYFILATSLLWGSRKTGVKKLAVIYLLLSLWGGTQVYNALIILDVLKSSSLLVLSVRLGYWAPLSAILLLMSVLAIDLQNRSLIRSEGGKLISFLQEHRTSVYWTMTVLLGIVGMTRVVVVDVEKVSGVITIYNNQAGQTLYIISVFVLLIYLIRFLVKISNFQKKYDDVDNYKSKILIISILFQFLWSITFNIILTSVQPSIKIQLYAPLIGFMGSLPFVILSFSVFISDLFWGERYFKFASIDITTRVFLVTIVLLLFPVVLHRSLDWSIILMLFLIATLIVFMLRFGESFLLRILEKTVFWHGKSFYVAKYQWETRLLETHDLSDILRLVKTFLSELALVDDIVLISQNNLKCHFDDGKIVYIQQVNNKKLYKYMFQNKYIAYMKVPINNNVRYILFYKLKKRRFLFKEESEILDKLFPIIKSSLVRAILYQRLQSFNAQLQVEVQEATSKLRKQLKRVQELRARERDMLDIMGHELRTPLSIIKITMDILNHKAKNVPNEFNAKTYLVYAERINDALAREIRLLEKMLSSAKIDAKRMKIEKERVDLVSAAKNAILAMRKKAEEKSLKLIGHMGRLEHLYIEGELSRVGEVVDNFVNNAVKYTLEGAVEVRVYKEKEKGKETGYGVIEVLDSGIGIPKSHLKKLGKKFYRVGQHLQTTHDIVRPGGSGLGLYVSFNLIKLMGGEYEIVSKQSGKGVYCIGSKEKRIRECQKYAERFKHGHGSMFVAKFRLTP